MHFCVRAPLIKLVFIKFVILLVVLVVLSFVLAAIKIDSLLPLLLLVVVEVARLVCGLAEETCILLEHRLHILLCHWSTLTVGSLTDDLGDLEVLLASGWSRARLLVDELLALHEGLSSTTWRARRPCIAWSCRRWNIWRSRKRWWLPTYQTVQYFLASRPPISLLLNLLLIFLAPLVLFDRLLLDALFSLESVLVRAVE